LDFSPKKELKRFLSEDIGKGDISSQLLPKRKINARIVAKEVGIIAGVKYVREIFLLKKCKIKIIKKDGSKIKPNQTVMEVSGTPQWILSSERTALNLLSRMSGIATQTNDLVYKIKKINPKVKLFATRKTAPGLRFFDKEAVVIGGGNKHRMRLDEMIMLKDNHLRVSGSLARLVAKARKKHKIIEVEVENKEDALIAARIGANIIMLDNFAPSEILKTIIILRKSGLRKKVKIEASGGITAKNINSFAKTGVDMISVSQITNSVKALDFSLEVI
jgi:nicotinate-nucleotide pyrophosphorylase (carboxylating)